MHHPLPHVIAHTIKASPLQLGQYIWDSSGFKKKKKKKEKKEEEKKKHVALVTESSFLFTILIVEPSSWLCVLVTDSEFVGPSLTHSHRMAALSQNWPCLVCI